MINKQSEKRTQHWWVWIHAIEDANMRSDEIFSAYKMKAKYKQIKRNHQINIWSHISWVSYYIQRCREIKKWFYVNVHDTMIKLQCKKMIQSQKDMMKQSQVQFFIIFSTEDIFTSFKLCCLRRTRFQEISISISQISQNSHNTDQLQSQL